jgi:hypothetical protein
MAKLGRQKRNAAKAKRLATHKGNEPKTTASLTPAMAATAEDGRKKETDQDAEGDTVQSAKSNTGARKTYRMSIFLSVLFLAISAILAAIAIASWQKGGYRNYLISLWWGIPAYLLLGVGAVFAYHYYVIKPAKEVAREDNAARNRPYVFFKLAALKNPLADGEKPVVQIVLANSGQTEAHGKIWDNTFFYEIPPFKSTFNYQPREPINFSLAPGAEMGGELRYDFIMTKEKLEALQSGKARLYFFSRGEYQGEDGTVYPLPFCRMYDKGIAGNLIVCADDVIIRQSDIEPTTNRGHISLHNINPPIKLSPDKEVAAYITWGNDGNSPAEITGGVIQLFISLRRPSEVVIPCDYTGSGVPPVEVAPHGNRIQKFTAKPDMFTAEQLADVNKGRQYFGICGQVNYVTLGQTYPFKFCTYYDPDEKAYVDCKRE